LRAGAGRTPFDNRTALAVQPVPVSPRRRRSSTRRPSAAP